MLKNRNYKKRKKNHFFMSKIVYFIKNFAKIDI